MTISKPFPHQGPQHSKYNCGVSRTRGYHQRLSKSKKVLPKVCLNITVFLQIVWSFYFNFRNFMKVTTYDCNVRLSKVKLHYKIKQYSQSLKFWLYLKYTRHTIRMERGLLLIISLQEINENQLILCGWGVRQETTRVNKTLPLKQQCWSQLIIHFS